MRGTRVGVISFAAYDESRLVGALNTPNCFDVKFGVEFQHFDLDEEKQVYGFFSSKCPNLFSEAVWALIHDITQGHPGLFHSAFLKICVNFPKENILTADVVYKNIISGRLNKPLQADRSFLEIL